MSYVPHRGGGSHLRFAAALGAAIILSLSSSAQLSSNYTFASSSGSFSAITGGTSLWGDVLGLTNFDNEVSGAQTIPAFNYNGTVYTQVYVSVNGFITFGSAPTGTNYTPLSSAEGYAGAISAFGTNLRSRSSSFVSKDVRIQTVGSEVVVQWRGVRRFNGGSEFFDAQARLNTTNGVIRFIYNGPSSLNSATSEQPEVGLRGPNNNFATNVLNRAVGSGAETWSSSLPGTANNSTMRFTSTAPSKSFSSGLTYTFTPNCTQPAATATVIPDCSTSTYTVQVNVTNLNGAPSVDVSSSVGGVFANDVGVGTYTTTPLAMGTAQTITVVHNGLSICNLVLGSFNSTCTSPSATTSTIVNCATSTYTVQVNVSSIGSAPSIDLVASVGGLFADNVGVGSYTTPAIPIGTPVSITMVHNCNTSCNVVLGPISASCTSPAATTSTSVNCATMTYTVQVNVSSIGSAPSIDLVASVGGLFADNVGVGSYTCPAVPIGTPVSITMVHNCNAACNVVLGPFNPTTNCVPNGLCLATMLAIPTNGCPNTNLNALIPITFPGTAMGDDVLLQSVDLIVAADLVNNSNFEIRLISPGGQSRNLVINRFGNGTNIGNPATCPNTFLRLIDGGTALTNSTINNVTGSYAPEQSLAGFTGDPNGTWTLRICDEGAFLSGDLKFVRLNFVTRGSGDPCAPRVITCNDARTVNSTASYANTLPASSCLFNGTATTGGTHWWSYTAASTGETTVSLCGNTTFNSRISAFAPSPTCSNLVCVGMNDDQNGCVGNSSELQFATQAGQTYLIAVHGSGAANGSYNLFLFCGGVCSPAAGNDACASATTISSVLADGSGVPLLNDNTCAHVDDPTTSSGALPAIGLWYTFNSGAHAIHRLHVRGNSFNPNLTATNLSYALYSGGCANLGASGELVSLGNAPALNALPLLTPNTDYRLLVYNRGGIGEAGTFRVMVDHPGMNDAGITAVSSPTGIICGDDVFPVVTLRNFGEAPLTAVFIQVSIDGGPVILSYPWTGNLAIGASEVVVLPGVPTPTGNHILHVTIVSPNGQADEIAANNTASSNYSATGNPLRVVIRTDNNGAQTTWEVFDPFFFPIANGGPYASNTTVITDLCLSSDLGSCYSFYVYDSFGDGLCCANGNGYWELRTPEDRVLLRDKGEFASISPTNPPATPAYALGHYICLPAGPSDILSTECGLFTNNLLNKVYCEAIAGVTQYQFEFSDPDAGFRRRIVVPQRWVHFGDMVTNPLLPGVTYFARVRVDRGAPGFLDDHFGTGCEMGIDPEAVPGCTQLIDDLDLPTHSCGVTKSFGGSDKIWAQPVVNGNLYKFNFVNLGEGYNRTIQSSNYVCILNWVTNPLQNGSTYDVKVNVLVNGQWSGYCGATCQVTILNPPMNGGELQSMAATDDATDDVLQLYPNPVTNGTMTLQLDGLTADEHQVTIDVFTLNGQRVMSEQFSNEGALNRMIHMDPSAGPGVYIVHIVVDDRTFTRRIAVL